MKKISDKITNIYNKSNTLFYKIKKKNKNNINGIEVLYEIVNSIEKK